MQPQQRLWKWKTFWKPAPKRLHSSKTTTWRLEHCTLGFQLVSFFCFYSFAIFFFGPYCCLAQVYELQRAWHQSLPAQKHWWPACHLWTHWALWAARIHGSGPWRFEEMESHQGFDAQAVPIPVLQHCCVHGTPKHWARLPEAPGGFGTAPSCPDPCHVWETGCFLFESSRTVGQSQSDQEGCFEVSTIGSHHHGHHWETTHAHHWSILQEVADLTMEDGFHVWQTRASIAAILVGQEIQWHHCVQFGMAPSGSEQLQDPNPDQHRTSGSTYSVDLSKGDRRWGTSRWSRRSSNTSQEEKEETNSLNAPAKSRRKLHKFHLPSSGTNFRHMEAEATKASLLGDIVLFSHQVFHSEFCHCKTMIKGRNCVCKDHMWLTNKSHIGL